MNLKNYKHLIQFILIGKSHFEEDGTQNSLSSISANLQIF